MMQSRVARIIPNYGNWPQSAAAPLADKLCATSYQSATGAASSTPHSKVPQWFRQQAKAFRARVLEADQQTLAATEAVNQFAKAILDRRHTFRENHLIEIHRQWAETMPDRFRIGFASERGRKSLTIADARLIASSFRLKEWEPDDYETTISIYVLTLHVGPGKHSFRPLPIGNVSLHAISRRFQRSIGIPSDEAISADLSHLYLQLSNLLTQQPSFYCDCDTGRWIGNVLNANTQSGPQKLLAVRTFF